MRCPTNSSGRSTISATREAIVVAVTKSARGAPAFDRQGALVAFVAPLSAEPRVSMFLLESWIMIALSFLRCPTLSE